MFNIYHCVIKITLRTYFKIVFIFKIFFRAKNTSQAIYLFFGLYVAISTLTSSSWHKNNIKNIVCEKLNQNIKIYYQLYYLYNFLYWLAYWECHWLQTKKFECQNCGILTQVKQSKFFVSSKFVSAHSSLTVPYNKFIPLKKKTILFATKTFWTRSRNRSRHQTPSSRWKRSPSKTSSLVQL